MDAVPEPPTREELLRRADRIVADLSPGRRESVREILINARNLGHLPADARSYLDGVTGSSFVGDVLAAALAERERGSLGSTRA